MNCNLLIKEMENIQIEYRNLLTKLLPILKSQNCVIALDEINIFWHKHVKIVNLYLEYFVPYNDAYVFTASTYMDVNDNEHFPFLLLGKTHIFDDPLSKYSMMLLKGNEVTKNFTRQVLLTAEDNIKIITLYINDIIVIPMRMLNQTYENHILHEAAEQYFVSLFNDIDSIEDYKLNCNTIECVVKNIKESAKNHILFTSDDDMSLSFEKRYECAKRDYSNKMLSIENDSFTFFSMVFGPIQQAIDILTSCLEHKCTPFIRNKVALHYALEISALFNKMDFTDELRYKMCVSHLVYCICDKNRFATIGSYCDKMNQAQFSDKLYEKLKSEKLSNNNFKTKPVAKIVSQQLEDFYLKLLEC